MCVFLCVCAVSYTHLDVYKRQDSDWCTSDDDDTEKVEGSPFRMEDERLPKKDPEE